MMPWESIAFSVANFSAMLGWILLMVFSRSKVTEFVIYRRGLPVALSIAYALILGMSVGHLPAGAGFNSLEAVGLLFSNRTALLAGWIHYLAFDLWIGTWITRDAAKRSWNAWVRAPFLLLTFLFGPVGLLAYLCSRAFVSHEFAPERSA